MIKILTTPEFHSKTITREKKVFQFFFSIKARRFLSERELLEKVTSILYRKMPTTAYKLEVLPISSSNRSKVNWIFDSAIEVCMRFEDSYFGTACESGGKFLVSIKTSYNTDTKIEDIAEIIAHSIEDHNSSISDDYKTHRVEFIPEMIKSKFITSQYLSKDIKCTLSQYSNVFPNTYENNLNNHQEFGEFLTNILKFDTYITDNIGGFISEKKQNIVKSVGKLSLISKDRENIKTTAELEFTYNNNTGKLLSVSFDSEQDSIKQQIREDFASYYIGKFYLPLVKASMRESDSFHFIHKVESVNGYIYVLLSSKVIEKSVAKEMSNYIENKYPSSTIEVVPSSDLKFRFIWNNKKDEPFTTSQKDAFEVDFLIEA